jgi:hypothetical protein
MSKHALQAPAKIASLGDSPLEPICHLDLAASTQPGLPVPANVQFRRADALLFGPSPRRVVSLECRRVSQNSNGKCTVVRALCSIRPTAINMVHAWLSIQTKYAVAIISYVRLIAPPPPP